MNNLFETTFHEVKVLFTPLIYFIASDVDDSLLKAPAHREDIPILEKPRNINFINTLLERSS